MQLNKTWSVVLVLLLACSGVSAAELTIEEYRPWIVTSDTSGSHTTTAGDPAFGLNVDGVVQLTITRSDGTFLCSGALLDSRQHILTAAHCLADDFGNNITSSVTTTFETTSGDLTIGSSAINVHPSFNGEVIDGFDLGIITLSSPVSDSSIPHYLINRDNTVDIGPQSVKVGYGQEGHGSTGSVTGTAGTKRAGLNEYESEGPGSKGIGGTSNDNTQLMFDFDSGLVENDAYNFWFGDPVDLGFGDDEVNSAPGDSGGPNFIQVFDPATGTMQWRIAGVTSYGFRLSNRTGPPPKNSDVTNSVDSSWGEFSVDARVGDPAMFAFIDSIVPEPASLALLAVGLAMCLTRGRRRI